MEIELICGDDTMLKPHQSSDACCIVKLCLLTGHTVCEEKAVNISYKLFAVYCR